MPVLTISRRLMATAAHVALAAVLCVPASALAQSAPAVSRPVVQALPNRDSLRLNAALARLGRDPRDVAALVEAGEAANAMGDVDAAVGFFRRADQMSPGNAKVKAGLAGATVLKGDPIDALPLFEQAEKAGASVADIAADRGLAYDLVGDNLTAQTFYKAALSKGENDEVRRRLALSQAIAGDIKTSEATLMPLLRKQDKPGWRARAFTLAISGDTKQAVQVANTILPGPLAESISPYLRYMPRLTPAQQAAAANLGKFPRASEIGRDDPRIAAYVSRLGPRPSIAAADAGLIPQGKALGKDSAGKAATSRATRQAATRTTRLAKADVTRVAPPEPKPTIERDSDGELPPVAATQIAKATPTPVPTPTPTPAPVAAPTQRIALAEVPARASTPTPTPSPTPARAPIPAPTPAPSPSPVPTTASSASAAPRQGLAAAPTRTPGAGFDLSALPNSQAAVAPPPEPSPADMLDAATPGGASPRAQTVAVAARPATAPPVGATQTPSAQLPQRQSEPTSLADVFADLGAPVVQSTPVSGAVDIRKIDPARPAPKPDPRVLEKEAEAKAKAAADKKAAEKKAKPAPPSHPSRIWVQIGVGRDKSAIAYDWRKWSKDTPALFKGRAAYVSDMGRTNRILAGPFESNKAANEFIGKLGKAGMDGAYIWTSPAGQVVDALAAK